VERVVIQSAHPLPVALKQTSLFEQLVFAGLVLGLACAPFWFGGNRPAAWAFNAIWACTLVTLYEFRIAILGSPRRVTIGRVWPAVLAFVVTATWCLLQVSTWLPADYHHPIWRMAQDALGYAVAGSISVDRDATVLALLRLVTAAAVFWLALQLARSSRLARWLVEAVAVIGFGYALYGLVAFFVFPKTILWFEKEHYLDSLTSTFVNRNSYATYAAMALIASVGVTLSEFAQGASSGSTGRQAAGFLASLTGGAGLWLAMTVVTAMSLVLSGSRGGIAAAFLGLTIGALLSILQRRGKRSPAAIAGILALLFVVAVAVAFGDLLADRLASQGLQSDDRLAAYAITLGSIGDRPWLGFGAGTFEHVFPMYRDATISPFGQWDKAHNTYLAIIQGLGIPVAALLMLGIGFLVWRCFFGALNRRRAATPALVASAASITVLAHAFVDFSLEIEGVTLTWMALVGGGVAQSWSSETDTSSA
jgi:O-antigen ligase